MQWFENEYLWRELYPYMFPPPRYAAAVEEVSQILALTDFTGHDVLDLCCGPGRHAVGFAQRGYAVTGVDASPFLLERALERGAEAAVEIEWVRDDMRRFLRPGAFDLAYSIFTSFGYFESEEDDLRVLRNVYESLKPGGAFVMEMIGKERLARIWQAAICTEFPDGAVLLQRPQLRRDWSRVYNEWTLVKDGRARTFTFEHSLYSGRELKDRLLHCGFREVRLFGDLQGAPFGLEAPWLVAVARR